MQSINDIQQGLKTADLAEMTRLIEGCLAMGGEELNALFQAADAARRAVYGRKVYFRGLIEFSSFCKNDCYYCGIRRGNRNAVRYRLTKEEILGCCKTGYALGFRTFVLQSGEDPYYTDSLIEEIVCAIKSAFPDCAVTLSIGEKPYESYKRFFKAGADRYLLRHETADPGHYARLHPSSMSLENRKRCLYSLMEIGYQVGAGFMVGSPYQTAENLAADLIFLRELKPHMIGIGPFIPHHDTVFAGYPVPGAGKTLVMLALIRLMLPKVLLPATTALGTVDPLGREKGLKAGANVVMPNLSPPRHRKDYALYDNKICTGEEAAECLQCLMGRIAAAGFMPDLSRGDYIDYQCPAGDGGVTALETRT